MKKFTEINGIVAPLPLVNIDTDMIIPKQFLKTIKRTGLGANLFDEMRFDESGAEIPSFVLNQDKYRNAQILVTGANFGCGSSREHAPWAIADYGINCIIAPSFADIFHNNCSKNAILAVTLPKNEVDEIMEIAVSDNPNLTINLEKQQITTSSGKIYKIEIDEFRKYCLLNGLDDISLTLEKEDKISAYEKKYC